MHRTTLRSLAALVFLALMTVATAAEAQELADFEGTYVYAGGSSQRSAFGAAIDKVVDQMNALVRGIARDRLHSRVKIEPRMSFRVQGDGLRIVHEPLPPRLVSFDNEPLHMRNRAGDRIAVTYRRSGWAFTETIRSGRSSQVNTYRFASGGGRLTFAAAISSPLLPAAIRYSLTYRRRGEVVRR